MRGKREVVALAYGGGAGTLGGGMQGGGMAFGGRRGMSDVAWHPDNVSDARDERAFFSLFSRAGHETCYFI